MEIAALVKKILCVEDHADSAEMVRYLLGEFDVTVATGFNEALYYASQSSFDLCLIDYHLPDGVGTDLLQLLRPLIGDVPAVFVSASSSLTRKHALEAGAVDLLNKGTVMFTRDLVITVKRLLQPDITAPCPTGD
jgi:CheY-like chemotaxis protein